MFRKGGILASNKIHKGYTRPKNLGQHLFYNKTDLNDTGDHEEERIDTDDILTQKTTQETEESLNQQFNPLQETKDSARNALKPRQSFLNINCPQKSCSSSSSQEGIKYDYSFAKKPLVNFNTQTTVNSGACSPRIRKGSKHMRISSQGNSVMDFRAKVPKKIVKKYYKIKKTRLKNRKKNLVLTPHGKFGVTQKELKN